MQTTFVVLTAHVIASLVQLETLSALILAAPDYTCKEP